MHSIFEFCGSGILLGLTAGMSPGPLLALVVSQTMLFNKKEGFKVAVAPLFTDIPIVFITIFVISKLASSDIITGVISMLGAWFIFYLAWDTFISAGKSRIDESIKPGSYRKGILVNFLSPHPYLFWLLVGAPLVNQAKDINIWASVAFFAGFYIFLVGSKMVIAVISEKSKRFMTSRYYFYLLRGLAAILFVFGIKFLVEGWQLLVYH